MGFPNSQPGIKRLIAAIMFQPDADRRDFSLADDWMAPFELSPATVPAAIIKRCRDSQMQRYIYWPAQMEEIAGWPLPAMHVTFDRLGDLNDWKSDGIDISPRGRGMLRSDYFGYRALPTKPVMRGFIFNLLFYANIYLILLWVILSLFRLPRRLRTALRERRGACRMCGYSLQQITSERCPECGAVRAIPPAYCAIVDRRRMLFGAHRAIGAGIVVTIGLAWGAAWTCEVFSNQPQVGRAIDVDAAERCVLQFSNAGSDRFVVWHMRGDEVARVEDTLMMSSTINMGGVAGERRNSLYFTHILGPITAGFTDIAPRWLERDYEELDASDDRPAHFISSAHGFPFRCLSSRLSLLGEGEWKARALFDAIEIPKRRDPMAFQRSEFQMVGTLPIRPIWTGLITNTLIYAFIWAIGELLVRFAAGRWDRDVSCVARRVG
ncbi:MAG: hypothetical protein IT430_11700 [Phycisphaerales bacterium]|nr:hypothetical protein [Phycisphaerales bacterium]